MPPAPNLPTRDVGRLQALLDMVERLGALTIGEQALLHEYRQVVVDAGRRLPGGLPPPAPRPTTPKEVTTAAKLASAVGLDEAGERLRRQSLEMRAQRGNAAAAVELKGLEQQDREKATAEQKKQAEQQKRDQDAMRREQATARQRLGAGLGAGFGLFGAAGATEGVGRSIYNFQMASLGQHQPHSQMVERQWQAVQGVGGAVAGAGEALSGIPYVGPVVGGVVKAVGGLISIFGKLGEAIFGSEARVRRWSENLHRGNMALASWSGAMMGVQARQGYRDITMTQIKGDLTAQSAEELARAKSKLDLLRLPLEIAENRMRNRQATRETYQAMHLPIPASADSDVMDYIKDMQKHFGGGGANAEEYREALRKVHEEGLTIPADVRDAWIKKAEGDEDPTGTRAAFAEAFGEGKPKKKTWEEMQKEFDEEKKTKEEFDRFTEEQFGWKHEDEDEWGAPSWLEENAKETWIETYGRPEGW